MTVMVIGQSSATAPASTVAPRLAADRCRALLGGAVAGHLALSQGALPLVLPVTCAVDGEYLLVRAGVGLLGRAPFQPGIVAFQTAAGNFDHSGRWEVMVQGRAEVLEGPTGPIMPPGIPLVPDEFTTVLRVSMELVTGWQYGGWPAGPAS